MLPAGSRLRRRADFTTTLRSARGTRAGGLLVVHVDASPRPPAVDRPGDSAVESAVLSDGAGHEPAPPRVGLVVSKAIGPAVTRNLVKRRLRHVLTRHIGRFPAGSRVVVRALPGSAAASSAELDAALTRALTPRGRA